MCWSEPGVMRGKSTGAIQVSLEGMSTIDYFIVLANLWKNFIFMVSPLAFRFSRAN